jgi:hypothetical protein
VFSDIVGAVDPEFFTPVDTPLLVEYARAVAQADKAAAAIAKEGLVRDERPSAWVVVQEKAIRAMVSLSARLRICPQSRFDRLKAGSHSRDQILNRMNDADDPLAKYRTPDPPKTSALESYRKR